MNICESTKRFDSLHLRIGEAPETLCGQKVGNGTEIPLEDWNTAAKLPSRGYGGTLPGYCQKCNDKFMEGKPVQWPEKNQLEKFHRIAYPLYDFARDILADKKDERDVEYKGLPLGIATAATCLGGHDIAKAAVRQQYIDDNTGAPPINLVIDLAMRLGMEQGRRNEIFEHGDYGGIIKGLGQGIDALLKQGKAVNQGLVENAGGLIEYIINDEHEDPKKRNVIEICSVEEQNGKSSTRIMGYGSNPVIALLAAFQQSRDLKAKHKLEITK